MAILEYGNLSINGTVISYEGAVKIEAGSKKRIVNPQVNGGKIITTDITTNVSKITVKVRVTPESNAQFDAFYDNGDNNTISFRDQNFSGCVLEILPEREDLSTVDYVFFGDPAI
jgi:hypothetical protein